MPLPSDLRNAPEGIKWNLSVSAAHFPWSPKSLTARWDTLWAASIRVTHPILCHSTRTVTKRLGPHLAFPNGMLCAYVTLLGSLFCLPSVLQDWAQLLLDWERVSFEPDYLQFGSFVNMTHIFGWLIYPSGNPSPEVLVHSESPCSTKSLVQSKAGKRLPNRCRRCWDRCPCAGDIT